MPLHLPSLARIIRLLHAVVPVPVLPLPAVVVPVVAVVATVAARAAVVAARGRPAEAEAVGNAEEDVDGGVTVKGGS